MNNISTTRPYPKTLFTTCFFVGVLIPLFFARGEAVCVREYISETEGTTYNRCLDAQKYYVPRPTGDCSRVGNGSLPIGTSIFQGLGGVVTAIAGASSNSYYCFESGDSKKLTEEEKKAYDEKEAREKAAEKKRLEQERLERIAREEKERVQRGKDERAAAAATGSIVPCQTGCKWKDLVTLGNNLIKFAMWFASTVVVVMFCLAGFKIITAGGDVGKAKAGRDMMVRAIVGLVVVLLAWLIVSTIINTFGGSDLDSGTGPSINEFIQKR